MNSIKLIFGSDSHETNGNPSLFRYFTSNKVPIRKNFLINTVFTKVLLFVNQTSSFSTSDLVLNHYLMKRFFKEHHFQCNCYFSPKVESTVSTKLNVHYFTPETLNAESICHVDISIKPEIPGNQTFCFRPREGEYVMLIIVNLNRQTFYVHFGKNLKIFVKKNIYFEDIRFPICSI